MSASPEFAAVFPGPSTRPNPLLALPFVPAVEALGPDYRDVVEAARLPRTDLRLHNDALFRQLGLDPAAMADGDVEAAYGRFEARTPLLALRCHGYLFGVYNPQRVMAPASSTASCATAMASCRTWAPRAAAPPPGAAAATVASPSRAACARSSPARPCTGSASPPAAPSR